MFSHFFFVSAHKFSICPDRVLRTVDLIHDEGHHKVYESVNEKIDLEDSMATRKDNPNVGTKD
jgi:hypothetical protein